MDQMVMGAGIKNLQCARLDPPLQAMGAEGPCRNGHKSIDRAYKQPKIHTVFPPRTGASSLNRLC
jgi:hypothetical protein